MHPLRTLAVVLILLAPVVAPPQALAADAQAVFNSLYSAKIKEVRQTVDLKDDAALARQMVDAADKLKETPQLLVLVCEAAHDLTRINPFGYDTAIAAMRRVAEVVPAQAHTAKLKIIDVQTRQYRAARGVERNALGATLAADMEKLGDERRAAGAYDDAVTLYRQAMIVATQIKSPVREGLQDKIQRTSREQRAAERLQALTTAFKKDPAGLPPAAARELVLIHLVDRDDPKAAAKHLTPALDAVFAKHVKTVALPVDKVEKDRLIATGDWLRALASEHEERAGVLLRRAKTYYVRRGKDETIDALTKKKIELTLADIDRQIAASGVSPATVSEGEIKRFSGHAARVRSVMFSPDGRSFVSGGDDRVVRVWDVATGQLKHKLEGHTGGVSYVELSRGDKIAMTVSLAEKAVNVWDVPDARVMSRFGHGNDVHPRFDMSADGRWGVVGGLKFLHLHDLRTGKRVKRWDGASYACTISDDGRWVAWGSGFPRAGVRSTRDGTIRGFYDGRNDKVYAIRFSPDGNVLAVGGPNGSVSIWNLRTSEAMSHLRVNGSVHGVRLSNDGRRALVQGHPATVWDTVRGEKLYDIYGATGSCSLSPDGHTALVPMGNDVVLWGLP